MGMVFRVYLLYLYRRFWLMVNLNYVIESQWERAPPITPSLMYNGRRSRMSIYGSVAMVNKHKEQSPGK